MVAACGTEFFSASTNWLAARWTRIVSRRRYPNQTDEQSLPHRDFPVSSAALRIEVRRYHRKEASSPQGVSRRNCLQFAEVHPAD